MIALPRATAEALLAFYRRSARALPWRATRDPWAVWVSEIMLQQTTVAAVSSRWGAFLERFPTPRDLAAAAEDEVLEAVQGLGYYRRFRALQAACRRLVEEGDGRVPDDHAALRALPGIGDYTAGAIASIAFGRRRAAIDGNAERVLARLLALDEPVATPAARRRLAAAVEGAMAEGEAAELNQAIFDLGAGPCASRRPRCEVCALASHCEAHRRGLADRLPRRPDAAAHVERVVAAALVRGEGGVLVRRRPEGGRMAGFWELPEIWLDPHQDAGRELAAHLRATCGVAVVPTEIARARHAITRYRLDCRLHACEVATLELPEDHAFVDPEDPGRPFSTISRKLLAAVGAPGRGDSPARRAPRR